MARETLHWDRPFHTVRSGGFETGDIAWFPEGGLNASYNCVDRWAFKHPDKVTLYPKSYSPLLTPKLDSYHLRSRRAWRRP
jgi:acetyl-CoA synthetase